MLETPLLPTHPPLKLLEQRRCRREHNHHRGHDAVESGTLFLAQDGIELQASAGQSGGNMEGKETRFGIAGSSLFAVVTTSFTTGSVNAMHDSFTPIGGLPAFIGIMLQCAFGGTGVGFLAALVYRLSSLGNAGPHGYSKVLYNFTAAAANNGRLSPGSTATSHGTIWRSAL